MEEVAEGEVAVRTAGGKGTVAAAPGMTVSGALAAAGVKPRWGARLFVNGRNADGPTVVKGGDTITVAPRIRNGA